jgi:uncharacterized protein YwgA
MTTDELRDWAILGRVVERVEEQKRFCGETLLQKSAYFLKEMFGAPISAPFRIYYYGPFSFDLRETLSTMEGLDVVQTVPHEWGATYRIGRRYRQVKERFPKTLRQLEPAIDWVMHELAPLGVKELEPLATALFLKRERPDANDQTLAATLHEIKPHVSVDAARVALQKVGEWIAATA